MGLVALVALAACNPVTDCEEASEVKAPALEIGIGDPEGFSGPVEEGALVVPAWGGQGGRHLWLSVHTEGLAPGEKGGFLQDDKGVPTFHATLTDDPSGVLVTEQVWDWIAMEGDPFDATLALQEFFLPWYGYGSADTTGTGTGRSDEPVQLVVTAHDHCGNDLQAEVGLVLDW